MATNNLQSLAQLLRSYGKHLLSTVSKVRILGDPDERELKDVFVELSITEQDTRQKQSEFLGLVDAAMRRRYSVFGDASDEASRELAERREKVAKRHVSPEELLTQGRKAIVTGAPGCGKTTLLKYLAREAHAKKRHLVVWLELKAIDKPLFIQAEKTAARESNLILSELWLQYFKTKLSLSNQEAKALREYWREKFKANEITVLLDGFDELQDEVIERRLNNCIREFASVLHTNTLLISTRPYAKQKLGTERLQELEIEPLNERQVEAFLNCYYPNDLATKSLLKSVHEQTSLRDLLHVPLLLGVILRLYRENRSTDDRLDLYETIVADLSRQLDRSKSVIRQCKINDEKIRLDFLKFLAFERSLRDQLNKEEQEANRILFSYELIKEKAKAFLKQERLSHNPRDLADDVLTTPLLREVGTDTFAFTHLSLQEYLAACAFADFYKSNEFEGLKILCHAYHNPTMVEMETLPMILGKVSNAGKLYTEIDHWPESLTFTNLRLRARGLAYSAKINHTQLINLVDTLLHFVKNPNLEQRPFRGIIIRSFTGANATTMRTIESRAVLPGQHIPFSVADLLAQIGSRRLVGNLVWALRNKDKSVRTFAAERLAWSNSDEVIDALAAAVNDDADVVRSVVDALSSLGSDKAVDHLISFLKSKSTDIRRGAALALRRIRSDRAVDALIGVLRDESVKVRDAAIYSLAWIGSEKAVDNLISVFSSEDNITRRTIAHSFYLLSSDRVIEKLITALTDEDVDVRCRAAGSLGAIGSGKAVPALISLLQDESSLVRIAAAEALGQIGSDSAVACLCLCLSDEDGMVRLSAAEALGRIHSERGLDSLIAAFDDENDYIVRIKLAEALARIGHEEVAVSFLILALNESDSVLRASSAEALRSVRSSDNVVNALGACLKDEDDAVRWHATESLGRLQSDTSVSFLISALRDKESVVLFSAAEALAHLETATLSLGLAKAIRQRSVFTRIKAINVIGYYSDDQQTLHQLEELSLRDKNRGVQRAARTAAQRLARKLELLGRLSAVSTTQHLNDNESRELFLVGEAFKVAAEAGHIFRPTPNSDWGIDGEIEFKNDKGQASGLRVYLQLKSGDSYLRRRKRDGKEIFYIKNPRHAEFWQAHAYPVLLVILGSGQIRWMNVTEYLQQHGTSAKQIEFRGEPFTAESVKQMRARFAR